MSAATVLAPGKLVLLGEYAVLDGGPALVMAIDRGVRCDITPAPTLEIETPDGDDRFVRPALQGAAPARYRFSAWNPVDLPGKPGFGGSAAACVAACVAAGRPALDALPIHRAVQGSGSGIDVLASALGGALRVQGTHTRPVPAPVPVVVYSGASARTGPRVERYRAWADQGPAHQAFLLRSAAAVDAFATDPLRAVDAARDNLVDMARQADLAYLTPGLSRIVALARAHGGAAKPSGAGGGDVAVAWFLDPQAQAAFLAACRAEGLPPIAVQVAPGARRLAWGEHRVSPPA
ncbi:hypothetical protein L6R53_33065 [Myxococcota bacterium]|nr:hypothetical protein [Myxococcota bacterium]